MGDLLNVNPKLVKICGFRICNFRVLEKSGKQKTSREARLFTILLIILLHHFQNSLGWFSYFGNNTIEK
jgi:hypothetical protein